MEEAVGWEMAVWVEEMKRSFEEVQAIQKAKDLSRTGPQICRQIKHLQTILLNPAPRPLHMAAVAAQAVEVRVVAKEEKVVVVQVVVARVVVTRVVGA